MVGILRIGSQSGEPINAYTYGEARRNLATLKEKAMVKCEVLVKRKDGQSLVLRPQTRPDSALNVEGVDPGLSASEISEAFDQPFCANF
jgi:hypothetical protein